MKRAQHFEQQWALSVPSSAPFEIARTESTRDPALSSMATLQGQSQKSSAILYENNTQTVVLIDIPASISFAQGTEPPNPMPWIKSCNPVLYPYLTPEPQSDKARAAVEARIGTGHSCASTSAIIGNAIGQINARYTGEWCLPRATRESSEDQFRLATPEPGTCIAEPVNGSARLKDVSHQSISLPHTSCHSGINIRPHVLSSSSQNVTLERLFLANRPIRNLSEHTKILTIAESRLEYRIPPGSTFLWRNLGGSARHQASDPLASLCSTIPDCSSSAGPGQFDAVVMDPPWDNRSVKRSNEYRTRSKSKGTQLDPFKTLECSLGEHIAPSGLVMCWITHKASVRQATLKAFRAWGLELFEEWIWVKLTARGEPVYDLDSLWRKPYEICLVGKKTEDGIFVVDGIGDKGVVEGEREEISRRVVAAVPDLHSRKPCLKELLERMLPKHNDTRVLEIFARNITAGWWALGNEVLKFQRVSDWFQPGNLE